MLTPRKLIAFLTLILTLFSTFAFADCTSLGPGWTQGTSTNNVVVCVPTGDNPTGAISSGEPVLTQNGKEYYAPPCGMSDKVTVDSTGRIGRTLDEVTRITRADGSKYVYTTSATFYTEAGAASSAVWDKVKAAPTVFPSLSISLSSASSLPVPAAGVVVDIAGVHKKIGGLMGSDYMIAETYSGGVNKYFLYSNPATEIYYSTRVLGSGVDYCNRYSYTNTSDPVSPSTINYSTLSSSVSASPCSGASDIDKLISQNLDSFKKSYTPSATEGLTAPPIPTALTPEKIAEIYAGNGAPSGVTGSPTPNPVTGIPELPPNVEIPQTPPEGSDPSAPPPNDVYGPGFTPGYNNSPYGSDGPGGAEFGNRLSQFMSDLRGSSLFSLPTAILGNIPSSGTSAISFDGGEFGQQSFDFAAFSNQLMVIRSVLLLCFSLLSIRIVTLKR